MSATLVLPARLDLTVARTLTRSLRDRAGAPLALDASQVELLGGLGLQVLLAAAREWGRRGARLTLAARSEAFDAALVQFGVSPRQLESGGDE